MNQEFSIAVQGSEIFLLCYGAFVLAKPLRQYAQKPLLTVLAELTDEYEAGGINLRPFYIHEGAAAAA